MLINGYNEANNILKNLRKFSRGDSNNKQRSASIITKNDQDRICSTKIKEIIKIADDNVRSRSASVTTATKPVNEVRQLKTLLSNYGVKFN
jgi:hypothetical protein